MPNGLLVNKTSRPGQASGSPPLAFFFQFPFDSVAFCLGFPTLSGIVTIASNHRKVHFKKEIT